VVRLGEAQAASAAVVAMGLLVAVNVVLAGMVFRVLAGGTGDEATLF
jgi:hypothetical protein